MANERLWDSIGPVAFTANGGSDGVVTVASVAGMRVKQLVTIQSNTQQPSQEKLEIKKVLSLTKIIVGPVKTNGQFMTRANLSAYLVADSATIKILEQPKSKPPAADIIAAVYEQEPVVGIRTFGVDELGRPYNTKNPLPVQLSDGNINIGTVNAELEVQLSHKDNDPDAGDVHDSLRIGDGVNEVTATKAADGPEVGLNTNSINDLFSKPFTKLTVLSKNDDGDPLEIRSSYNGVPVQLLTIVYDAEGDFEDAEVSNL